MNRVPMYCLALFLLLPQQAAAEVVIVPHEPAHAERPAVERNPVTSRLATKVSSPSDFLVLPFFTVDTTDASGSTTLYAIRNRSTLSADVAVFYYNQEGFAVRQNFETIGPLETMSVNIRDVPGLPSNDGVSRGFATFIVDDGFQSVNQGSLDKGMVPPVTLTGDFFQVDVGGAFATGERLIGLEDLCEQQEIRFLDFGSGTKLQMFVTDPQGNNPAVDPPSVTVQPITEDGGILAAVDIFTNEVSFELQASDITTATFGTLIFSFSNSSGGWVYGEYSADGLFSVGLNSTCTLPRPAGPI